MTTQGGEDGEHRQAGASDNGGAVEGAGDGAGTFATLAPGETIAFTDASGAYNYATNPFAGISTVSLPPGSIIVGWGMTFPHQWTGYSGAFQAAPISLPVVPHEGIVMGEIEGWRAWKCSGDRLRSYAMDYEWPADEPAHGDVSGTGGIHAFKTREDCEREIVAGILWAIGKVKLWGEVVEHETGYRAEYGRVVEIVSFPHDIYKRPSPYLRDYYSFDAAAICKRYGLPMPKPPGVVSRILRLPPPSFARILGRYVCTPLAVLCALLIGASVAEGNILAALVNGIACGLNVGMTFHAWGIIRA